MQRLAESEWYTDSYSVYHKDLDFQLKLRLSSLLLMIQETAWNHARVLAIDYSQESFRSLIWVLSRMHIDFVAPAPGWMENVRLATSPTGLERMFAIRDFIARDGVGNVFARVSSAWLLIDSDTRQLRRPQSFIDEAGMVFGEVQEGVFTMKLNECEGCEFGSSVTPSYADIDGHQHVNNVKYVEWCLNEYTPDFLRGHDLSVFDINFVSELAWGERVSLELSRVPDPKEDGVFLHTHIVRKSGSKEVAAIMRLKWIEHQGDTTRHPSSRP